MARDLDAIGTVSAVQGVTVSADLPGIVDRISFDSGKTVARATCSCSSTRARNSAQLAAAQPQRDLARLNLERLQDLLRQGVVSRAEFDAAAAAQTGGGGVREIRATIERKTIRAPFSGVLGIRQVNLGQYLAGGDPVVPLQAINPVYVDFGIPQQDAGRLASAGRCGSGGEPGRRSSPGG